MTTEHLRAGDVLSYSAGSTRATADGYRFIRRAGEEPESNMVAEVAGRWPELLERLHGKPPLVINAYPATIGTFAFGIVVDSYLNHRTVWRALRLAREHGVAAVLLAQPLFAADVLLRGGHGAALPCDLLIGSGGYAMPASLERTLVDDLSAQGCDLEVVHFYGAAEVDAGCMLAKRENGDLVYHPRSDISVNLVGGCVELIRPGAPGGPVRVQTEDEARPADGGGFMLGEPAAAIVAFLEEWSCEDWRRRTGWLARGSGELLCQLRVGVPTESPAELDFYDFARSTGMSWVGKPAWNQLTTITP